MQNLSSSIGRLTDRVKGDNSFGTARTDYATISRNEYKKYQDKVAPVEDQLLQDALGDTSLIDAAPENATRATEVAKGIQTRNIERYGGSLTPAQRKEMERDRTRSKSLTTTSAINFATRDQKELNLQKLSMVLNSGTNSKNTGLSMMQQGTISEAQRQQGFNQAKAQARATNIGVAGTLATLAVFSDKRLKENIQLVGQYLTVTEDAYNIYKWDWNNIAKKLNITSKTTGVLAQEILLIKPSAVSISASGYYMVNYGEL